MESLERKRSKLLRSSSNRCLINSPRFPTKSFLQGPTVQQQQQQHVQQHRQQVLQKAHSTSTESSISPDPVYYHDNTNVAIPNNNSSNSTCGTYPRLRHKLSSGSPYLNVNPMVAIHQPMVSELTLDSPGTYLPPPPPPPSSPWETAATMSPIQGEDDDDSSESSSVTPESSCYKGETGD